MGRPGGLPRAAGALELVALPLDALVFADVELDTLLPTFKTYFKTIFISLLLLRLINTVAHSNLQDQD